MNFCSSLFLVVVEAWPGVCPAARPSCGQGPAAPGSHSTVAHSWR